MDESKKAILKKAQANGFGQKGVAGRPKLDKWGPFLARESIKGSKEQYLKDNNLPDDWEPPVHLTPGQIKLNETVGVVYFALCAETNKVKIGWSSNVERRLKALQTGSPSKLTLIGTIPGKIIEEGKLHKQFDAHRVQGEWFDYTDELKVEIENLLRSKE